MHVKLTLYNVLITEVGEELCISIKSHSLSCFLKSAILQMELKQRMSWVYDICQSMRISIDFVSVVGFPPAFEVQSSNR